MKLEKPGYAAMKTADRRPTKPFAARLSEPAHALIHARAHSAGISARAWLEAAILADRTAIIARAKPHPDLAALLYQVNKAGNNLNQLAHRLNAIAQSNAMAAADVGRALEVLTSIQRALNEALNRAR